jgi:hypothetical protein
MPPVSHNEFVGAPQCASSNPSFMAIVSGALA